MNVLLVQPNCCFQTLPQSAPLGLLSIAAYIKQHGFQVRVYDRNVEKISFEKVMRVFRPDAVGVAVTSVTHIKDGVAVSHRFRRDGIPVIWGGHMASVVPEMVLREGGADYTVIGEGEITFFELLRVIESKSDVSQVKGIAYLDGMGALRLTPEREFADLADLPVIDWSLVNPKKYFTPRTNCKRLMYLYASKGCPGRCAFCFNESFHHRKCRRRPVDYVMHEIAELSTKHGMDGVSFADDMFGQNKKDLYDLCGRLQELNPGIVWGCETRFGHLSHADLQVMYDAGCRWIYYGVDSGCPEMLGRIHKNIDLEKIGGEIESCKEIGILSRCGIIIGLPDETEEQLLASVRLMLRLDPHMVQVTAFFPIPGTEFYQNLIDDGRLPLPKSLLEWDDFAPQVGMFGNFSNVPSLDLRVVQGCFFWRDFFKKSFSKNARKYEFALNAIAASLRHLLRQGFFNMFRYVFSSAKLFFAVAWYAHAYPDIRKKYGLNPTKQLERRT